MTQKVALITGAARGIGLATARIFFENGYRVLILDRDEDALDQVHYEFAEAYPILFDVSNTQGGGLIVKRITDNFGRLDALVNNAGIALFGPIEDATCDLWREVMATNLDGVFYLTQSLTGLLKKTKGTIVNIASISGLRASTLRVAYGTSKAAVMQLTKQQAVELGEYGIRVNAVAPGPVRTKLAMGVHTQQIIEAYHDHIPLNRYGSEREIGEVVYFLSSEKASYLTGQIIAVDGGFDATGVGLPALRDGNK
ncbi:MAG: SDR family oxidoreductase [Pseudomonadota bacterium]|nr:SDR family oxidoreductase [Pseudomonadota bacterium]